MYHLLKFQAGGGTTDPPVDEGEGTMKENVTFDVKGRFTDGIWTYMKGDNNNVSVNLSENAKSNDLFNGDTVILDNEHMPYERLKDTDGNIYLTTSYNNMFGLLPNNVTSLTIDNWTNTNVTDMSYMFSNCSSLTSLTLGDGFDISNVTNMGSMFTDCNDLKSLTLFKSASSIIPYLPEATWSIKDNTQNDTGITVQTTGNPNDIEWSSNLPESWVNSPWTFKYRYPDVTEFNEGIWTYKVETGTDGYKYLNAKLNRDAFLNEFGSTTIITLGSEYMPCNQLMDNNEDIYLTTSYKEMFTYLPNNVTSLTIDDWTNTNVTDMGAMFAACLSLITLKLGDGFDTSNVTDINSMFWGCSTLTTLTLSKNFNISDNTDMYFQFHGCSSLKSLTLFKSAELIIPWLPNGEWSIKDTTYTVRSYGNGNNPTWNPENPTNQWGTDTAWIIEYQWTVDAGVKTKKYVKFSDNEFTDGIWNYTLIKGPELNYIKVKLNKDAFSSKFGSANAVTLDFEDMPYEKLIDIDGNPYITLSYQDMFSSPMISLLPYTVASLKIQNWTNTNVTVMSYMFAHCSYLDSINLETEFDTSNVTYMNYMFSDCRDLKTLRLGEKFIVNGEITSVFHMQFGTVSLNMIALYRAAERILYGIPDGRWTVNEASFKLRIDTYLGYEFSWSPREPSTSDWDTTTKWTFIRQNGLI